MPAVLINTLAVLLGATIGVLFGSRISERFTKAIMSAIALITLVIGIQSAIKTGSIMLVMLCLVIGTLFGTALHLDDLMNGAAEKIQNRLRSKNIGGRFAEAFMTTTILFCVGTMTVIGSIQAGLEHNYEILIAKSVMDFLSSIVFGAALGGGVFLSALSVLVIQGGLVLLASLAEPVLTERVVTEMSAIGGTMFIGMSINLLELRSEKIKIGDMLPAIFLPIAYFPIADWLASVF